MGKANISGEDMYMSAMRGKCLNMIHCYFDHLWALGDKSIEVPLVSKKSEINNQQVENEEQSKVSELDQNALEEKMENLTTEESCKAINLEEDLETNVDHEEILTDSFLAACKFKYKEIKLPVVVSTFMKTMQSCWLVSKKDFLIKLYFFFIFSPPDVQFDLKKTRFKKISVFLKEMQTKGCVKLKDQKGVLSITDINKENDL